MSRTPGDNELPAGLRVLFETTLRDGRPLVPREHEVVAFGEPFVLATRLSGGFLEQAILRVTTFAYVLSAIVGTLVLVRAAPWPIGFLVVVWVGLATGARVFLRRRRAELGDHLIDFESERFAHLAPGPAVSAPLSKIVLLTRDDPLDGQQRWITVTLPSEGNGTRATTFRIAHGTAEEIAPILYLFRRHGVREAEISVRAA